MHNHCICPYCRGFVNDRGEFAVRAEQVDETHEYRNNTELTTEPRRDATQPAMLVLGPGHSAA